MQQFAEMHMNHPATMGILYALVSRRTAHGAHPHSVHLPLGALLIPLYHVWHRCSASSSYSLLLSVTVCYCLVPCVWHRCSASSSCPGSPSRRVAPRPSDRAATRRRRPRLLPPRHPRRTAPRCVLRSHPSSILYPTLILPYDPIPTPHPLTQLEGRINLEIWPLNESVFCYQLDGSRPDVS